MHSAIRENRSLRRIAFALSVGASLFGSGVRAEPTVELTETIDRGAAAVEARVIAWRRDIHQHPELSNREFRTGALVADHLEELGLEVRRKVAHTGVIGVLRGGRPGPTVALRADMDALPVTEAVDMPFASTVRSTYLGQDVGVMHACGHDAHTAILLGAAEVLAGAKADLPGTVLFVFQPAEERPPPGEKGGAELMLAEGAFDDPKPDAAFALHAVPQQETGEIAYRAGGAMASSDVLGITVRGRQTHAASPWLGVDPIATAARIVTAIEAIPARNVDVRIPSVVSIGTIHGGVRYNIIPDEVELMGTIRSLDADQRVQIHESVRRIAENIARSAGAQADVRIPLGYPVTVNDPALTERMLPTLRRIAGDDRVIEVPPRTGGEDFAFFAQRVPGLYLWLGVRPPGVDRDDAAPNHSPNFFLDEDALVVGVRLMAGLAVDYLTGGAASD